MSLIFDHSPADRPVENCQPCSGKEKIAPRDSPGKSLGSLSTRVFETRTATGSELFSLLTCLHTKTFTLLSIFSPLEMISIKIRETPLPWYAKCSLPVAVRISRMRVLKLPIKCKPTKAQNQTANPFHSRSRDYVIK